MGLIIDGAAITHAGKVRLNNEDNYNLFGLYRSDTEIGQKKDTKVTALRGTAVAVFDGMGGEEAGEVASLIAAKSLTTCEIDAVKEEALCQIQVVNKEICEEMRRRGGIRMGTTLAALYLDQDMAVCCNVGDSRCYFMRKSALRQLSVDHTEAQQMVNMGLLSQEQARKSKSWHKLTQHLGIFPEEFIIEPHFSPPIVLKSNDVFLLCSDGLTDMVKDEQIAEVLNTGKNAEEMADALVKLALSQGGRDNVTALVLQVKEECEQKKKGSKAVVRILAVLLALLVAVSAWICIKTIPKKGRIIGLPEYLWESLDFVNEKI